ncbi:MULTISPECIES: hypothetical protein [Azospirillum]|uniref:Uncharacterized protein n=1 Tax=Azospirillum rugosum TaxID=416170 RepID=A0ABS4SVJ7_9PROT|nr:MULTISPECIES: hypothetical protein [Azospirillum]MBP2296593.1 hypothetical protein [Azospirillum rugosum]MDQ0530348.1 hypothetical protein [Azospirillum rugosum]
MNAYRILGENVPPIVAERISSLLFNAVTDLVVNNDAIDLDFQILSMLAEEMASPS